MKAWIFILLLTTAVTGNAAIDDSLTNNDHVRRARINKSLSIGTGVAGAGLFLYTGTYHIVQNAYWNDQSARWEMQYNSGMISKDAFDQQMKNVQRGRAELRSDMRRNYLISGGLLVASIGFGLNARRHTFKIGDETSFNFMWNGVSLVHRF